MPGPRSPGRSTSCTRPLSRRAGKLVVDAGGDTPTQQDGTKAAFNARFPDIDLTLVVDYSKYHDVRVDNQFATDTLVPDVVQLQTLQDFVRWKQQGRLLPYRPAGFSKLYDAFRDPQGAWVAVSAIAFSFMHGTAAVGSDAPRNPLDLVDPKWKGKIASSYPHDDDAVLTSTRCTPAPTAGTGRSGRTWFAHGSAR